jgi:hypothetical protein
VEERVPPSAETETEEVQAVANLIQAKIAAGHLTGAGLQVLADELIEGVARDVGCCWSSAVHLVVVGHFGDRIMERLSDDR